jgi:hypothetical protein
LFVAGVTRIAVEEYQWKPKKIIDLPQYNNLLPTTQSKHGGNFMGTWQTRLMGAPSELSMRGAFGPELRPEFLRLLPMHAESTTIAKKHREKI